MWLLKQFDNFRTIKHTYLNNVGGNETFVAVKTVILASTEATRNIVIFMLTTCHVK